MGEENADAAKILVLSLHSPFLDRRIVSQVNTLVEHGRDVILVTARVDLEGSGLDSSVVVKMPSSETIQLSGFERLKDLAWKLPHPVPSVLAFIWRLRRLFISRSIFPIADPQRPEILQLVDFFLDMVLEEYYDVIHCHDLHTLPAGLAIANRQNPRPRIIYDSHELFPFQTDDKQFERHWTEIERENIKQVDLIITINDSIADIMSRQYGVKRPEIIFNSYGVNGLNTEINRQKFLDHFRIHEGGFNVIFQGGFDATRNMENMVRAFKLLDNSTKLLLLGQGPLEGKLRHICKTEQISNVHFGRWVPQIDLLGYVRHADLGLIPYIGDTAILNNLYCTPNKLFEFIEAEIPICASDIPELRKILKDNGNGDVYTMTNPEQIAEAVRDCKTRIIRNEFSPTITTKVKDTFSWKNQKKKFLQLYENLGL